MSRYRIAEQLHTLAEAIRCEDPDTAASLDVLEDALRAGLEDEISAYLAPALERIYRVTYAAHWEAADHASQN